ncbi:glycosyltransferase LafA, responsible for the formation of Glc-DAG [Lachnospiraceae bacterium KM106-2]|nr:glycosyltransferase LafA, responsible for the formation of Glc-DAG [Lachnospiraceae bacterium KM106-2]
MNIGLFTDTYYPEINGVANSVFVLKSELEKRGHNVYVFTTTTPGSPDYEFNVFRLHSIPFVFMPDRRVGMFYDRKLAAMIRRLNLDIIHTHTEFSLRLFACTMAKELNIPIVHTYHTIYEDYTHYFAPIKPLNKGAKAFARKYTKRVCNQVEEVIVPTEKTKELLEAYHVYKNINVVPTGIMLSKFSPSNFSKEEIEAEKRALGIAEDDKVILYLGRVSPEKNIEELIQNLPALKAKHDNVRFVIIGAGPDIENLQKITKEEQMEDTVIFAGEKPWDKIGFYYQLGDVFVSASQSETQGLTYIEAMAAGLPVVARDDRCLDEILQNGYNGYKFHDGEEFVAGLEKVLFGDTSVDYRQNSINMVANYSVEAFGESIEEIYTKVIHEAGMLLEA